MTLAKSVAVIGGATQHLQLQFQHTVRFAISRFPLGLARRHTDGDFRGRALPLGQSGVADLCAL